MSAPYIFFLKMQEEGATASSSLYIPGYLLLPFRVTVSGWRIKAFRFLRTVTLMGNFSVWRIRKMNTKYRFVLVYNV